MGVTVCSAQVVGDMHANARSTRCCAASEDVTINVFMNKTLIQCGTAVCEWLQ
jgi:hypothetical protein